MAEFSDKLSHVDDQGKACMVNGGKKDQLRVAKATGFISLQPQTVELVKNNSLKKGDVLAIADRGQSDDDARRDQPELVKK